VQDESAFLHTITHLTDKLNFTAAVRYTVERKNFSIDQAFIYGGVPSPSVDVTAPQLKYNKTNPKFGLDYQFTEGLMGYASYSTGFRGGGFNNRPFDAAQVFQINPENLDSYELGVKSQWFDHHLTVNLAGYDSEYHNFQTTVGGVDALGVPFSSALNVGDARIRGAELELLASLAQVPGLQFSLTGSYTDGKITKTFAPPGLDVSPASLPPVGAQMQNVPVWQGSAGVQYTASLGQLGTLTPRYDVSSNSSIYFSALNTPYSLEPGHTVSNVRLTWDAPRDFQVTVAVTNVFDRFYYTSRLDTYSEGLGYLDGAPAPPREWELSIKKTFK
jgi:iron complex outermembrane receptor protein